MCFWCFSLLSIALESVLDKSRHARIQRGEGAGGPDPLKNHKNIGFLVNTDPNPLSVTLNLPSQHSMLGHHRHASEKPFQWRFAGGPMMTDL